MNRNDIGNSAHLYRSHRTLGRCLTIFAAIFASALAHAQAIMEYENPLELTLNDNTKVTLLRATASLGSTPKYYYLPTNLRLSKDADGVPMFSLVKFTTDKSESNGGAQGALLHFLMEYGLTKAQEAEVKSLLNPASTRGAVNYRYIRRGVQPPPTDPPKGELLGCAPLVADGDAGSFIISSGTLSDTTLAKSIITSGKAPTIAGEKVAVASRLTSNGAQLLSSTFDRNSSIADISVTCKLGYYTMLPAVKGTIKFHAEKLKTEVERLRAENKGGVTTKRTGLWPFSYTVTKSDNRSYEEAYESFNRLADIGVLEMKFEQTIDNETTGKFRDAFFQSFLAMFTQKSEQNTLETPERPQPASENGQDPTRGPGPGGIPLYTRNKTVETQNVKDWTYTLTARIPVLNKFTITDNIKKWFPDIDSNREKCIRAINLNDPFFTTREINFILDLDARDIFDEYVNYVTVNVRKNRSSGRPFQDSFVIDSKYIKEKGISSLIQYSRGNDNNPDNFEYQMQWSLRGGEVFPQNPQWKPGNWRGEPLTAPVKGVDLSFDCTPEDLKSKDLVSVTAQVHYMRFGQEAESNIRLSASETSAVKKQRFFRDKEAKNYSYRLIFVHKKLGRLVTDWVHNASDEYIYATIPEDILTLEAYKERGKNLVTGAIEKVLGKIGGHN
ncbi:MAG: hypothetical protein WCI55_04390 [Armatimonadota bacterium]